MDKKSLAYKVSQLESRAKEYQEAFSFLATTLMLERNNAPEELVSLARSLKNRLEKLTEKNMSGGFCLQCGSPLYAPSQICECQVTKKSAKPDYITLNIELLTMRLFAIERVLIEKKIITKEELTEIFGEEIKEAKLVMGG